MAQTEIALDPAALSAFAASLAALPAEEVRKAKCLFIQNAIADFEAQKQSAKGFLWVFAILSLIPVFLVVFIPTLIAYRASNRATARKIRNALSVWKEELGSEYERMLGEIDTIQPQ